MLIESTKNNIKQSQEADITVLDFGHIPYKSTAITTALFKGNNLTEFSLKPTCGCTVATPVVIDTDTISASIQYNNTHKRSSFSIILIYSMKENGSKIGGKIRIKGTVV